MRIVIYMVLVIVMLLPLLFRRFYWLRVFCVLVLGFAASLHCVFLLTGHRLVLERGLKEHGASFGDLPPGGISKAVTIVQELNHDQLTFIALLFISFAVLALLPFQRLERRKETL